MKNWFSKPLRLYSVVVGAWLICHLAIMIALPSLKNDSNVFYLPVRFGGWMLVLLIIVFAGTLLLIWRKGIKTERLVMLVFTASLGILLFSVLAFGAMSVHQDSVQYDGHLYTLAGHLRAGEPGYYRVFRCDRFGLRCNLASELNLPEDSTGDLHFRVEDNQLHIQTADGQTVYNE